MFKVSYKCSTRFNHTTIPSLDEPKRSMRRSSATNDRVETLVGKAKITEVCTKDINTHNGDMVNVKGVEDSVFEIE